MEVFVTFVAISILGIFLNILSFCYESLPKLGQNCIKLIAAIAILFFIVCFGLKVYIQKRTEIALYYSIYPVRSDCVALIENNPPFDSDGTDGGIQSLFQYKFEKYCVTDPDVSCVFGDVVFYKPDYSCRRNAKVILNPVVARVVEMFPFNQFVTVTEEPVRAPYKRMN